MTTSNRLHRLEACKSLGLTEIEANVVELDDLDRQIAECDENLCGTKLTPSERAVFTRRRKEAYEAKHPETRNGGDRKSDRKVCELIGDITEAPHPERFTADTAKKTGQSERKVQLDAHRAEKIDSDVLASIAGTDLDKGTILDSLASIAKEDQARAVANMRSTTKPAPAIKNIIGNNGEQL